MRCYFSFRGTTEIALPLIFLVETLSLSTPLQAYKKVKIPQINAFDRCLCPPDRSETESISINVPRFQINRFRWLCDF